MGEKPETADRRTLKSRIRSEPDTDRVQFAGRSETGTKKILTVLKVLKHYIVFRDRWESGEIPFPVWGFSSAGRAPALQAGGQRFDPANLHHIWADSSAG